MARQVKTPEELAMATGTYQGKITLVRKASSPGGPLKIAIPRRMSVEI